MSRQLRSRAGAGRRSPLEKIATHYLRRVSHDGPVPAEKHRAHILYAADRTKLRRVHRAVVLRAGIAGALSALVSAAAAVCGASWFEGWSYWLFFGGITLAATVVEILFLYLDGLWAAHRISVISGLNLFPGQSQEEGITSSMVIPA